jgi:hypothetical protein
VKIDISVDVDKAMRQLTEIEKNLVPKATAAALNKIGVTARTEAAREIARATGLKVSEVKNRVPLIRATKTRLIAILSALPFAPNLARFKARQTKQGVSAHAWGRRKIYRGTFLANKGRTVFRRMGKRRLPIAPVHGPSVPRTFMAAKTQAAIRRVVTERFKLEFDRALAQFLRMRR